MPKYSPEVMNNRCDEIVDACERLYQKMTFEEITLVGIGKETSFTRTSVYTYFQTKEEIFLALLKREFDKWAADLEAIAGIKRKPTAAQLAKRLAQSLGKRVQLLKLFSMNLYAIEENSRPENLTCFKVSYKAAIAALDKCLKKFDPSATDADVYAFNYAFLPFMYGIYPYVFPSRKQVKAMKAAGMKLKKRTVYQLAFPFILKLLEK